MRQQHGRPSLLWLCNEVLSQAYAAAVQVNQDRLVVIMELGQQDMQQVLTPHIRKRQAQPPGSVYEVDIKTVYCWKQMLQVTALPSQLPATLLLASTVLVVRVAGIPSSALSCCS